jgi:hypothetical protein
MQTLELQEIAPSMFDPDGRSNGVHSWPPSTVRNAMGVIAVTLAVPTATQIWAVGHATPDMSVSPLLRGAYVRDVDHDFGTAALLATTPDAVIRTIVLTQNVNANRSTRPNLWTGTRSPRLAKEQAKQARPRLSVSNAIATT